MLNLDYDIAIGEQRWPKNPPKDMVLQVIASHIADNITNLRECDWMWLATGASKFAQNENTIFDHTYLGYDYYDMLSCFASLATHGSGAHWAQFKNICLSLYTTTKR